MADSTAAWLDARQQGLPDFSPVVLGRGAERRPRKPRHPVPGRRQAQLVMAEMMLAAGDTDDRQLLCFVREASQVGVPMARRLLEHGLRCLLLRRGQLDWKVALPDGTAFTQKGARTRDGRFVEVVRGYYSPAHRLIVVGEEHLRRGTVIHEMAHAVDYALTDLMGWGGQRLSHRLWKRFAGSRRSTITRYAATNPEEYFAESVQAFFNPFHNLVLERIDPGLHDYLRGLFAEGAV